MTTRSPHSGSSPSGTVMRGRAPRQVRVAEQLRQELSSLILTEMKDPRVRLASVSSVITSPDLRSARVRISALGSDEERQRVVAVLRSAEGFLRAALGHRLENLKTAPHLHFELDESIGYSVHISSLLRDLERHRRRRRGNEEGGA